MFNLFKKPAPTLAVSIPPSSSNWLTIPPTDLQIRVSGGIYPDFLTSGQETVENLASVLLAHGRRLSDFKNTLDFGCGCARTTRFLPAYGYAGKLTGVDVDETQINFSRGYLSNFADFVTIPFAPPMPFADAAFDFIYSISTFTHFREDYQHIWLRELQRITAPGGILILTIAGKRTLAYINEVQKAKLESDGIVYIEGSARGDHNPDYYHLTLHSHDYVRSVWSEYFEILDIVPEIINYNQHAVVCRKR